MLFSNVGCCWSSAMGLAPRIVFLNHDPLWAVIAGNPLAMPLPSNRPVTALCQLVLTCDPQCKSRHDGDGFSGGVSMQELTNNSVIALNRTASVRNVSVPCSTACLLHIRPCVPSHRPRRGLWASNSSSSFGFQLSGYWIATRIGRRPRWN